jgi:hypothetical protein
MVISNQVIKPILGFTKFTTAGFLTRLFAVFKGMDGNPKYTLPPVSMAAFKAAIDEFMALMANAADGSRTAIAELQNKRVDLTVMLRSLGHYVEGACEGDLATFLSSGFEPAYTTYSRQQPLPKPAPVKITQGNTGQLSIKIQALPKARFYELEYTVSGSADPSWTMTRVTTVVTPVTIDGLTPGTTYTFRLRGYGIHGFSDWSNTASRMCI